MTRYAFDGATTSMLYLTRGEGGSNQLGQYLNGELAHIRYYELNNAASIIGVTKVEQMDFPDIYANSPQTIKNNWHGFVEKLAVWIRTERPDVILLRFAKSPNDDGAVINAAGDDGAAHTATTDLMLEAIEAAANQNFIAYNNCSETQPYKVPSVVHTNYGPYAHLQQHKDNPLPSPAGYIRVDLNEPTLAEVDFFHITAKAAARSHRSQFGPVQYNPRQGEPAYVGTFIKRTPDEIDLNWGWDRVNGAQTIKDLISTTIENYKFESLEDLLPELAAINAAMDKLYAQKQDPWITIKQAELKKLVEFIEGKDTGTHTIPMQVELPDVSITPDSSIYVQSPNCPAVISYSVQNHTNQPQQINYCASSGATHLQFHQVALKPNETTSATWSLSDLSPDSSSVTVNFLHSTPASSLLSTSESIRAVQLLDPPFDNLPPYISNSAFMVVNLKQDLSAKKIGFFKLHDHLIQNQLQNLGAEINELTFNNVDLNALTEFDFVIIGEQAFKNFKPEARSVLEEFVSNGGKLLILSQMGQIYQKDQTPASQLLPPILPAKHARMTTALPIAELDSFFNIDEPSQMIKGAKALVDLQEAATTGWHPLIYCRNYENDPSFGGVVTNTIGKGQITYCGFDLQRVLRNGSSGWDFLVQLINKVM